MTRVVAVWQNGQSDFGVLLFVSIFISIAWGLFVLYCGFAGIFSKCVAEFLNVRLVECIEFA